MGVCYLNGHGVIQDLKKAVEYFEISAKNGNSNSQYYLGYCYHFGKGISQDYTKAVEWYTNASDQNN